MIKKILAFLVLFLVLGIFIAERHPRVKNGIGDYVKNVFESTFNCTMTGTVKSVHLYNLSLEFEDVTVVPRGHTKWEWHADRYVTSLSWRDLLSAGMMALHVHFENLTARSQMVNNKPAILEHLRLLVKGPCLSIVTFIKTLSLHHVTFSVQDPEHPLALTLVMDAHVNRAFNCLSAHCGVHDLHISHGNMALLNSAQGTIDVQSYDTAYAPDLAVSLSCACTTPLLPTVTNVVGSWEHDHGNIKLSTHDGAIMIDSCQLELAEQGIKAIAVVRASLKALGGLIMTKVPSQLDGLVTATAEAAFTGDGVHDIKGDAKIADVRYADIALGACSLTFAQDNNKVMGDVQIEGSVPLQGSYVFDRAQHKTSCNLLSPRAHEVPLTQWAFEKGARLTLAFDTAQLLQGTYAVTLANAQTKKHLSCAGTIDCDGNAIALRGTVGERPAALRGLLFPYPQVTRITYGNADAPLLVMEKTADSPFQMSGHADIALMKEQIALWGYQMHGQGGLGIELSYADQLLTTKLALHDGTIQLPKLYNCMSALEATVCANMRTKEMSLSNGKATFHQGTVACAAGSVAFDDSYHLQRVDMPIVFDSWLFATAGEFSAVLSGQLTYHQDLPAVPHVAGAITIERATARENIFSERFLQRIRSSIGSMQPATTPDATCAIDITTRTPFHVNTSFLETDAHLNLHVRNRLQAPELSGSIELSGGKLAFPYQPLFIRKGALYFVAGVALDPLIELVAQNTVKSHEVRLQVSGSLSMPTVMLESTPSLSDEQIVSLLLSGSPHASLMSVAPALAMKNLTSLLVDNIQSSQTLNHYLGSLLKPFKQLHVIPRFSDQSSRGGIRTALEVDVNDRWRALIQKNLSLTEDTRFELEYLVSDDISIKGTRNERGDVIGEVEMRVGF